MVRRLPGILSKGVNYSNKQLLKLKSKAASFSATTIHTARLPDMIFFKIESTFFIARQNHTFYTYRPPTDISDIP